MQTEQSRPEARSPGRLSSASGTNPGAGSLVDSSTGELMETRFSRFRIGVAAAFVWLAMALLFASGHHSVDAQQSETDLIEASFGELPAGWEIFDYSSELNPGDPWIDITFIYPDPSITVPHVTLFMNR